MDPFSLRRPATQVRREGSTRASEDLAPPRIAHTLAACTRCRTRKTRCDPGLPRCTPCERTNSHCEYFDHVKNLHVPRNYVVHLQHRVRDLERELAELEKDEQEPDAEDVMRGAAAVRIQESDESKFLGPSSGIAITRLVMQLAKQFTDTQKISDIVPEARQRLIKETFAQEEGKPTSKTYPLISDVPAENLPTPELTNLLVQLFYMKVHPMYPIFHEPTFSQDVKDVYAGSRDPYQNFCLRMVIAISLQRMDTQYAGLADSYYLAALQFLEASVKPMDLRTLQCFALIAGYSLLTPTRTAVYYIIGMAVRLVQALGLNEEKTIISAGGGQRADPLEVDMRRRMFWIVLVMECGLSHSLGRPCMLATKQEHIDVKFHQLVDDVYIAREGILPTAPTSLKKWIAVHFFKMRMLQLEIRRTLYQKKRPMPVDDSDPWFKQMEAKMIEWRDSGPETDEGSGLNKIWFIGRYNTMIVFLFRPSPQVPRPSLRAATLCYEACEFNIHMQREQIQTRSVEMTWIFTQSIFMCINTMLWTLSYSEVRRQHSRDQVQRHLLVALEAIRLASERWPGVASAIELYRNLIDACMKIYDKDGDINIAAGSPSDIASISSSSNQMDNLNRSRTTSPTTIYSPSMVTPPERQTGPFGHISPDRPIYFDSPQKATPQSQTASPNQVSAPRFPPVSASAPSTGTNTAGAGYRSADPAINLASSAQFNPLPATFAELPSWRPSFSLPHQQGTYAMPPVTQALQSPAFNGFQPWSGADNIETILADQPQWTCDVPEMRLSYEQQHELMHDLETSGTSQIQNMIQQSISIFGSRGST